MAEKKVIYKEPSSYFSPGMKKAAREWEKEQKAKSQNATKKKSK